MADAFLGHESGMAIAIGPMPPVTQANRTAVSFDGDPNAAPLLEVTFTPIPEPSAIVLAILGFVALLIFRQFGSGTAFSTVARIHHVPNVG